MNNSINGSSSSSSSIRSQLNDGDAPELGLKKTTALPVGFFEDTVQDAKARNVDLKKVQLEQSVEEWETFQAFVADVEESELKVQQEEEEAAEENEAREQLEQMQYLDRYRKVLEVAAQVEEDRNRHTHLDNKRSLLVEVEDKLDDDVEGESSAVSVNVPNTSEVAGLLRGKKKAKRQAALEEDKKDEAFDPMNWRSKGL